MTALRYTHPLETWEDPAYPVDGPPFDWDLILYGVIHWPGHDNVPDGDIGDSTDIPAFLRSMHRRYLRKRRPYSLGYGGATDYLGGTWGIRGDRFRNAANKPADFNLRSISQTILTDLDGKVTQEAIDATNDLIDQWEYHAPGIIIIGHGQGNRYYPTVATACPGPIADLIDAGIIGVQPAEDEMTKQEMEALADLIERRIWQTTMRVPVGDDQHLVEMTRETVLREAHQLAGRAVRGVDQLT